jgi:hypothetical protein
MSRMARFGEHYFDPVNFSLEQARLQEQVSRREISPEEFVREGVGHLSPHLLFSEEFRGTCIFEGAALELKAVIDSHPRSARGWYSCPECHMLYSQPVDEETQKSIKRNSQRVWGPGKSK